MNLKKQDNIKPPSAPEVEAQILGAIIIDNNAALKAFQILRSKHFYSTAHGIIYEVMASIFENGTPIDTITLYQALQKIGKLDEVGGAVYLSEISQRISSSANVEYHCKIVLEKWMYRSMITICNNIAAKAYEQTEDAFELASRAVTDIEEVINILDKKEEVNFYDRLSVIFGNIEAERRAEIETTIKCVEFPSLNNATGGLQGGNLMVISGKWKAGKTRFGFSLLRDYAVNKKVPVGMIGFEMVNDEYDKILLSMQTGTRYDYLRDPANKAKDGHYRFSEESFIIMKSTAETSFEDTKIFISDSVIYDVELIAKIRYWNHKHGVKIFCVDYLQMIQTSQRYERRDMEISYLSRTLKNIARQLNVIIIVIVQENEKGESAESKGPLRDCDFWFSVTHPIDEDKQSIKIDGKDVPVDQSIFKILFKASRHSPNGGAFLTKFYENGEYKEYDHHQYNEAM